MRADSMPHRGRRVIRAFLACGSALLMPQGGAHGQTMVDESVWRPYLTSLSAVNHPANQEGAESLGPYGSRIGLAYARTPVAREAQALAADNLYRDGGTVAAITMPGVYVAKGLPWGVNLGASYGALANGRVSMVGGSASVTVFEAPRLPAVALRAGYGRISGLQGSQIGSWETGAVASWGFLSYFGVYTGYGWQRNDGRVTGESRSQAITLSQGQNATDEVRHAWGQSYWQAGVRAIAWPPFLTLTAGAQKGAGEAAPSWAVTLGFST